MNKIKDVITRGLSYAVEVGDQYTNLPKEQLWKLLREQARVIQTDYDQQVGIVREIAEKLKQSYEDIENLEFVRKNFPEETNQVFIKNVAHILKSINQPSIKLEIIQKIQGIALSERNKLITSAISVLQPPNTLYEIVSILQAVYELVEMGRENFIEMNAPLLKTVEDKCKLAAAIRIIGFLPQNHQANYDYAANVVENINFLFNTCASESLKIEILDAIGNVPIEQRADVIDQAVPLLQDTDSSQFASVIEAVSNIPADQKKEVIESVRPLLKYTDGQENVAIVQAIIALPTGQRREVVGRVIPLLKGMTNANAYEIIAMLKAVQDIAADYPINQCGSILQTSDGYTRAATLMAIRHLPQNQIKGSCIAAIARDVSGLFSTTTSSHAKDSIIDIIQQTPADQRWKLIALTLPLLKNTSGEDAAVLTLEAVKEIPVDKREAFITSNTTHLQAVLPNNGGYVRAALIMISWYHSLDASQIRKKDDVTIITLLNYNLNCNQSYLVKAIQNIPVDQRADVINTAMPLFEGISDGEEIAEIIETVNLVPKEKGEEIIAQIAPQIQKISDGFRRAIIFMVFNYIPQIQRDSKTLEDIVTLLGKDFQNGWDFLNMMQLIAPQERAKFVRLTIQINKENVGEIPFRTIFTADRELQKATYDHLRETLNALVLEDQEKAYIFSWLIMEHVEALAFHESNPVYQRAIEVNVTTEPDALRNKKNPHRVYYTLKTTLEKEQLVEVSSQRNSIGGKAVFLDLATMRERGKAQVTFKDLPEGIHPTTIKTLFENLEDRLNALHPQERAKAEKAIKEFTEEDTVYDLKASLMSMNEVERLLKLKGSPEDPVDRHKLYLYTILRCILDKSNELSSDSLLSPQEEMLLKVAVAIKRCSTGQRDSIGINFNLLPIDYRAGLQGKDDATSRIYQVVDNSVQSVLRDIFKDDAGFLAEVTGEKANQVNEGAHQTMYLMNRLHKQLGLQYCLQFDQHTGFIYDTLIDEETKKLVEGFMQYCSPLKVINQAQKDISEAIAKKKISYVQVLGLIEKNLSEREQNGVWQPRYMKFNKDDKYKLYPQGITEVGAAVLLKAIGYLKSENLSSDSTKKRKPTPQSEEHVEAKKSKPSLG